MEDKGLVVFWVDGHVVMLWCLELQSLWFGGWVAGVGSLVGLVTYLVCIQLRSVDTSIWLALN